MRAPVLAVYGGLSIGVLVLARGVDKPMKDGVDGHLKTSEPCEPLLGPGFGYCDSSGDQVRRVYIN